MASILATVRDQKRGSQIYVTEERWYAHILQHHPELEPFFDALIETLKHGKRKQDPLDPSKYYYYKRFDDLPDANEFLIVVVLFREEMRNGYKAVENNFVVTAYPALRPPHPIHRRRKKRYG